MSVSQLPPLNPIKLVEINFETVKHLELENFTGGDEIKEEVLDIQSEDPLDITENEPQSVKSPPQWSMPECFQRTKKSKSEMRRDATTFDTAHVAQLVKTACSYYDLSLDEFAKYVLHETRVEFIKSLLNHPNSWLLCTEEERRFYVMMSSWLQKSIKDRISSVNVALREEGLPEKEIQSPDQIDQTRKLSRSRTVLKSTSDLLVQLKADLRELGITIEAFSIKYLGGIDILKFPPTLLDEVESPTLNKFLFIQQWLCLPQSEKLTRL